MTIQYTFVFVLLIAEMAVTTILLLPIPMNWRASLMKWLSKSPTVSSIQYYFRYVFVFVLILFFDAVNRAVKSEEDFGVGRNGSLGAVERNLVDSNLYIRMFRAQRNMYLCGFTLFLMLILSRFQAMILELAQMQESAANLEDKLLGASEQQQKSIEEITKQLKKKTVELETMTKQTKSQQDEYMRLTDRYSKLERQLEGRVENKKDI